MSLRSHTDSFGSRQLDSLIRLAFATAVLSIAFVVAGCGGGAGAVAAPGGAGSVTASAPGEEAWALRVLELTNEIRIGNGLDPLEMDPDASLAAYAHAWDMDQRNYFAHENPDGDGPAARLRAAGVEFDAVGENLARGQTSPEQVVEEWMASPDHRVNILYPGWTHIGIGVHTGPSRGPWWTQDFYR